MNDQITLWRIVSLSPRDGSVTCVTEWMENKPQPTRYGVIESLTGTIRQEPRND